MTESNNNFHAVIHLDCFWICHFLHLVEPKQSLVLSLQWLYLNPDTIQVSVSAISIWMCWFSRRTNLSSESRTTCWRRAATSIHRMTMTLRLTPVTRRRTQSVTVARDTVPSPHSPALSDGRRRSRRSVVRAVTTYARYGIHCSWLQESKLIVILLTLEWILWNMCDVSTGFYGSWSRIDGCLRLDPDSGIWVNHQCMIKTCRSRSKRHTCFKISLRSK